MLEILKACWLAAVDLVGLVLGIVLVLGAWVWDVLYHLHVSAPRLEGLLVGVVLTWVMLRRDRHPLLRVLSAPLKLVVDILDLAWNQVTEVLGDLWGTARDWTTGVLGWCKDKVVSVWAWGIGMLTKIKEKLSSD
jgi:hypothetical protein